MIAITTIKVTAPAVMPAILGTGEDGED